MPVSNHGYEYRERLGADAEGCNVVDYLARRYPHFTHEEWASRVRSGRVLLDGTPATEVTALKAGLRLSWMRPPWVEPEVPLSFAVLHRDEELVAVAKPRGLPTMPGGGIFMEHTLLARIRRRFPGASPLHRLGRGTSGIVLFAQNPKAFSKTSRQWSRGGVLKIYRALVSGTPEWDRLEIDVPIGKVPHPLLRTIHAAKQDGKPALSIARVLERRTETTLVEVRIVTGRPHQVRIHMAAAGYPLAGDPLYIPGGIPAPDSRALPGDPGYFLHAGILGFPHPATGKWIEIFCGPPPPLRL